MMPLHFFCPFSPAAEILVPTFSTVSSKYYINGALLTCPDVTATDNCHSALAAITTQTPGLMQPTPVLLLLTTC
jgi:hypothetical protein